MRFLIDTNVLISSEPTRNDQVEETTRLSLDLARLASGEHQLLVHPTVVEEIARDRDEDRRDFRLLALQRYPMLDRPPDRQPELIDALGDAAKGSHDWFDDLLLACVVGDAVHGLITQDERIHRKARKIGVGDRVLTVPDAVAMLSHLAAEPPDFIPSVDFRPIHSLDLKDHFFDSLREDYPFDDWFRRVAREGREAFVVEGPLGEIAGICILKEDDDELRIGGRVAKISTLKVADEFKGNRYGELLLKALFRHAAGRHDALWLTVFDRHLELIALLESFGFQHVDDRNGERYYVKRLRPAGPPPADMDALEFHVTFGPPAVQLVEGQVFIIPIQPRYHRSLFPDAPDEQLPLLAPLPHGNALRKAYLCRANLRSAQPGATLLFYLFYRSEDRRAVTAIGVLERSLVSSDADEILRFVGSRTVYSADEVRAMAAQGSVLAMLFRQDRFLEPPIKIGDLMGARAVSCAPQTTIKIQTEAIPWLRKRLDA
jgi:ribosomal protein S18 acetylase RimI-like enzyme